MRDGGQRSGDRAQPQPSLEALAHGAEVVVQTFAVGEDALGPLEDPLSLRGQPLVALLTLDDLHAQLGLEPADARRQRGLGDVAGGGSTPEVALARQRGQIGELLDQHGRSILRLVAV
jgi:hypothetical protein